MSSSSVVTSNFNDKVESFKKGCEKILFEYMRDSKYPSSIFVKDIDHCVLFEKRTPLYIKLYSYPHYERYTYTFAIIEIATGNVYRPSSMLDGTLNRKKAIVRGNIFDEFNGLKNVRYNGPQDCS